MTVAQPPHVAQRHVTTRRKFAALLAGCGVVVGFLAGCSPSTSPGSTTTPTLREVSAVLAEHARAVLAHDRPGFLDDVDSSGPAREFHAAQAAQFANLVKLPFVTWSYAIDARTDDRGAEAAATKKYGRPALIVAITLSYRLRGIDAVAAKHDLRWTFVRRDGRVQIAGDDDLADVGGPSWQGPWDFGPLDVVRGHASLVLGHPADSAALPGIAAAVDAAVPAVTSVWGANWTRDVEVIVATTAAERAAALGSDASSATPVAAVAENDGPDPVTRRVVGPRLVVEPAELARLSPIGTRITFRHEVTHLASADATTDASPRWLVEGFADYVGNLGSGQPVRVAAAELAADLRRGRLPATLPADAAFDSASTAAQSYESSWLACRLIAARVGTAGLVHFYRLVGASPDDSGAAVSAALAVELHESTARFVTQWRAYLSAQLG